MIDDTTRQNSFGVMLFYFLCILKGNLEHKIWCKSDSTSICIDAVQPTNEQIQVQ